MHRLFLSFVLLHAAPEGRPSSEDLIRGVEDAEKALTNYSVTSQIQSLRKPSEPGQVEREYRQIATYTVESSGRSRYRVKKIGPEPKSDKLETVETFDGEEFRAVTLYTKGSDGKLSASAGDRSWEVDSRNFTTQATGFWVSALIRSQGVADVAEERWEDRPVWKVALKPVAPKGTMKNEFWIDPARGFAVVRKLSYILNEDKQWVLYRKMEGTDYVEAAPSIWVPRRFLYESYRPAPGGGINLRFRDEVRNENWVVNEAIPRETFRVEYPAQTFVIDAKLGTTYKTGTITDQALADSAAEARTARSLGGGRSDFPRVALGVGIALILVSGGAVLWRSRVRRTAEGRA